MLVSEDGFDGLQIEWRTAAVDERLKLVRDKQDENRIASPEMFPEAEMLPHLICSRPMFTGGAKDEANQHSGA